MTKDALHDRPSFQAMCRDCDFSGRLHPTDSFPVLGFIAAYIEAVSDTFSHRLPKHLVATVHHTDRTSSPFLSLKDIRKQKTPPPAPTP